MILIQAEFLLSAYPGSLLWQQCDVPCFPVNLFPSIPSVKYPGSHKHVSLASVEL